MTLKTILDAWLKFWFAPEKPIAIGLFRIFFGLLVLDAAIIHIGPDVLDWYGMHGVTSNDAVHRFWWQNEARFDIFLLADQTDAGILSFWYVFVAAAFCLTIGLWTRGAAVVVTMFLISMDNRQPFAINGGDAMMRLLAGYLMFSAAGKAFSVDRLISRWRKPTFGADSALVPAPHFGQRMIQVQMAITYWSTFCAKISGEQWLDGTAVYYATRLDDMINHPMFLYDNLWFCKFLTWYTLIFEGAMFSFIWLRDLRYWVLAGTLVMHLGIDWSINLPVFEWVFMSSFVLFIYPEHYTQLMDWLKGKIESRYGAPTKFYFDPNNSRQTSMASVVEGLDIFGRLQITPASGTSELYADTEYGDLGGFDLFAWLTKKLPLLWLLYPLIFLPWSVTAQKAPVRASEPATDTVVETSSPKSAETKSEGTPINEAAHQIEVSDASKQKVDGETKPVGETKPDSASHSEIAHDESPSAR